MKYMCERCRGTGCLDCMDISGTQPVVEKDDIDRLMEEAFIEPITEAMPLNECLMYLNSFGCEIGRAHV